MSIAEILSIVIKAILIGIPILMFLVFIHEFGHFITAKFFKVKVDEFGFGFPPRLWGRKKGETTYSINAIPAGGFVRLHGEDGDDEKDPRSFSAKSPWIRAAIIAMGAIINLLLAFLIFSVLIPINNFRNDFPLTIPGNSKEINMNLPFGDQENGSVIMGIYPGSSADKAGISVFDKIESVNGQKIFSTDEIQKFIDEHQGEKVRFELYNIVSRKYKEVEAVLLVPKDKDDLSLGVSLGNVATVKYSSLLDKVFIGPFHSANMMYYNTLAFGSIFSQSVEEKSVQPVTENIKGPIGIVFVFGLIVDRVTEGGLITILETIGLISLALGVMNLLPIPALDGGRLFFVLIEGFTGKKINPNVERMIHSSAFLILLVFIVLISFNDIGFILRLVGIGS